MESKKPTTPTDAKDTTVTAFLQQVNQQWFQAHCLDQTEQTVPALIAYAQLTQQMHCLPLLCKWMTAESMQLRPQIWLPFDPRASIAELTQRADTRFNELVDRFRQQQQSSLSDVSTIVAEWSSARDVNRTRTDADAQGAKWPRQYDAFLSRLASVRKTWASSSSASSPLLSSSRQLSLPVQSGNGRASLCRRIAAEWHSARGHRLTFLHRVRSKADARSLCHWMRLQATTTTATAKENESSDGALSAGCGHVIAVEGCHIDSVWREARHHLSVLILHLPAADDSHNEMVASDALPLLSPSLELTPSEQNRMLWYALLSTFPERSDLNHTSLLPHWRPWFDETHVVWQTRRTQRQLCRWMHAARLFSSSTIPVVVSGMWVNVRSLVCPTTITDKKQEHKHDSVADQKPSSTGTQSAPLFVPSIWVRNTTLLHLWKTHGSRGFAVSKTATLPEHGIQMEYTLTGHGPISSTFRPVYSCPIVQLRLRIIEQVYVRDHADPSRTVLLLQLRAYDAKSSGWIGDRVWASLPYDAEQLDHACNPADDGDATWLPQVTALFCRTSVYALPVMDAKSTTRSSPPPLSSASSVRVLSDKTQVRALVQQLAAGHPIVVTDKGRLKLALQGELPLEPTGEARVETRPMSHVETRPMSRVEIRKVSPAESISASTTTTGATVTTTSESRQDSHSGLSTLVVSACLEDFCSNASMGVTSTDLLREDRLRSGHS